MKHTLMRLVFVELEACISVMAVVVGVIIVCWPVVGLSVVSWLL
jgi:hypothetical protein